MDLRSPNSDDNLLSKYREKTPFTNFVKPQVFSLIGPGKFFMHTTHLLHLWWKHMPT